MQERPARGAGVGARGIRVPRLFYGWWIVIAGSLGFTLSTGFSFHSISAFFPAMVSEFGWSRTAISGAFTLARLEYGLAGPIEGYLTDRLGPRRMVLIGGPLMGLGFLLFTQVNSLLMFYLVFILGIALGSTLGFTTPIGAAVANWFHRKRGKAFGLLWTGHGLGGVMVPIISLIIVTGGWRWAATFAGLLMLVLIGPVAMVMRHRPEDYGYLPDGEPPQERAVSGGGAEGVVARPGVEERTFTAREALRTPAFWLIGLSVATRQVVTSGMSLHLVILLMDRGVPQTVAGAVFASMAFMTVPGRLGLSWLGDYLDKRLLMGVLMGLFSLGVFLMSRAPTMAWFVPFLLLFALCWGGLSTLPHPLTADYFGRRYYATITGFMAPLSMMGLMSGPLIAGRIFDVTQSYDLAFNIFTIVVLVGMALILAARRPRLPRRGTI